MALVLNTRECFRRSLLDEWIFSHAKKFPEVRIVVLESEQTKNMKELYSFHNNENIQFLPHTATLDAYFLLQSKEQVKTYAADTIEVLNHETGLLKTISVQNPNLG